MRYLKTVVSVGEACPPGVAARWCVGPTLHERLWSDGGHRSVRCWGVVREIPEGASTVPIGRPIANAQAYVLDERLSPVPIGVPGELHIGGVSLARGYLKRADLTAEKFIANPFVVPVHPTGDAGARLYKTGDLVRYRSDGNLEFLGRIDQQVKIRGYRIELGEVEAVLEQLAGVQQAVARRKGGHAGRPLCGRYRQTIGGLCGRAARGPCERCRTARSLRKRVPDYMVPLAIVMLEQLPLTPNGKVDRKALPAPEWGGSGVPGAAGQQDPAAPQAARTPVEGVLAGIFEQVLGVEHVGIYDNFFELGGHSLLATQAASRVRNVLDVDLPLPEPFRGAHG